MLTINSPAVEKAIEWIERIKKFPGFLEFLREEEAAGRQGRKELAARLAKLEAERKTKIKKLRDEVTAAASAMREARAVFAAAVEHHAKAHQTLSSEAWRFSQLTAEIRDALMKHSPRREELRRAKDNLERLHNAPVREPHEKECAPIRLDIPSWDRPADTDHAAAMKEREGEIERARAEIAEIEAAIEAGD
jgi:hypothetical protein